MAQIPESEDPVRERLLEIVAQARTGLTQLEVAAPGAALFPLLL